MALFRIGDAQVELTVQPVAGDAADDDRQAAWSLYVDMATRVSVRGRLDAQGQDTFGEVLADGVASLKRFFDRTRELIRGYPVGRASAASDGHLGAFALRMLETVHGPFLDKWHTDVLHWWNEDSDRSRSPVLRQQAYPHLQRLLADWTAVRKLGREVVTELAERYGFGPLAELPPGMREGWGTLDPR